jgi:hypothetical protein
MRLTADTRVTIINAGSQHDGRTGVTATGEGMWNDGTSADRVVIMDDTGERLVFEGWMLQADEDEDATPRRENVAHALLFALVFALILAASWAFAGIDPLELGGHVVASIRSTWSTIVGWLI